MFEQSFIKGNTSKGRFITPRGIVLHHTGDYSVNSVVNTFTNPRSLASAHVLILKTGDRIQFAYDNQRTWHSGRSEFKGENGCNNFMLGVEFHGDTYKDPLTELQILSFIDWALPRIEDFNIKEDWITDHRTVSPERKVDLNPVEFDKIRIFINYLYKLNQIRTLWKT